MPNSEFNINNTELDQQYHYGSDWIVMPMMPLRGTLVFPHVVTHLDVGRDRSLNAINDAMEGDANYLFLAMQKDPQLEEPLLGEIYEVGTVVKIRQLLKLPGGTVRLLVEGLYRARRVGIIQEDPYFLAEIEPLHSIQGCLLYTSFTDESEKNLFDQIKRREADAATLLSAGDFEHTLDALSLIHIWMLCLKSIGLAY